MNIETANELDELRVATNALLNEQKISAARVVTVNRYTRPAALLSFDYYGVGDRGQEIAELNGEINLSYMSGDIKVLTDDNS